MSPLALISVSDKSNLKLILPILKKFNILMGYEKKDEFIVYQGSHGDRGAEIADLILPSATYTEQNGLYENLEGRIQEGKKASYPIGEALEDWKIFNLLNKRVKNKELFKNYKELLEDTTSKIKNNKNFDSLPIIETKNIKFKDNEISGTYDVKIFNKVWDIKSASPYSFKYK